MADKDQQNPVDQLVDLFVYAPVGLLYEYQEVIPKLVRRGKSQVQIARVLGQVAVNRGGQDSLNQVAGLVASTVARQITDFGASIGLAPPAKTQADSGPTPPPPSQPPPPTPPPPAEQTPALIEDGMQPERLLPIAGYDDLTAKEIIALLADLDPDQLERIRAHEQSNRARKTVLGKLDRLGS